MLDTLISDPKLIPAYLFFALLIGVLGWQVLKFIVFIIIYMSKKK